MPRAGRPDGGRILHTAADVGRMRQHNKARVGPEQALERAMLQKALTVAGNAVKFHAPSCCSGRMTALCSIPLTMQ